MLHSRLEEVALNAWPSLQQVLLDGWLLRFSYGYTKRANSVQPLCGSSADLDEKIAACEALYAAKGQPCIFRLTPFSQPAELDRALEERGYVLVEPSRVMHRDLHGIENVEAIAELQDEALDSWMELYRQFHGLPGDDDSVPRAMLEAIWPERRLVSLRKLGVPVTCGLVVREREFVGLFDLVTDPGQRNRGYGARLVAALLAWASERGAVHAYLQVVGSNAPACHLYEKLGFRLTYEYWYRVQHHRSARGSG